MYFLAPFLVFAVAANATLLTLQSPRLTVLSPDGDQLRSEPLALDKKTLAPVKLSEKDRLKITFQVLDKDTGKGVQPHQTFLRFYDAETHEEGIQPIRVTSGGKAKFELNMNKPPISLPPSGSAPLQVSLIIGSPAYSPLKLQLFDLQIPASQPVAQHPDEASFHPRPVLEHTFRPAERVPPKPVSAVFSLLALSPWLVLLTLWGSISPRVPQLFSPSILPFTVTLGLFEGLLLWYWIDLKLGQVLLYGTGLGLVTLFTGKTALASIGTRRLGGK